MWLTHMHVQPVYARTSVPVTQSIIGLTFANTFNRSCLSLHVQFILQGSKI